MSFKFFQFLIATMPFASAMAAPTTEPSHSYRSEAAKLTRFDKQLLVLPAPQNLVVTNTTTTSIDIQWDPVPGAVDYRVAVFFAPGGPQVIPGIITSNTTASLTNLPSGTQYEIYVAARDASGQWGDMALLVASTNYDIIITDVVVKRGPQQVCTLTNTAGVCNLSTTKAYWAELVKSSGEKTIFVIKMDLPSKKLKCTEIWNNYGKLTYIDLIQFGTPCDPTQGIVRPNCSVATCTPSTVAHLTFVAQSNSTTSFKFVPTVFTPNNVLYIYNTIPVEGLGGLAKTNNDDPTEIDPTIDSRWDGETSQISPITEVSVSPVPFQGHLNVTISDWNERQIQEINLDLFDLSGKLHRSTTLPASETVALDTEGLPVGMYFLRVKVGETVRVLKAVKGNQ